MANPSSTTDAQRKPDFRIAALATPRRTVCDADASGNYACIHVTICLHVIDACVTHMLYEDLATMSTTKTTLVAPRLPRRCPPASRGSGRARRSSVSFWGEHRCDALALRSCPRGALICQAGRSPLVSAGRTQYVVKLKQPHRGDAKQGQAQPRQSTDTSAPGLGPRGASQSARAPLARAIRGATRASPTNNADTTNSADWNFHKVKLPSCIIRGSRALRHGSAAPVVSCQGPS